MAEVRASRVQLAAGFRIQTGERHTIKLIDEVTRLRLVGMFFDLNKCFLLPSAMTGIRGIKRHYDAHPQSTLLVVGHTDTSGNEAFNLTRSLERARAVSAYLKDDVAAWLPFFGSTLSQEKRWGSREVQLMLSALPEGGPAFYEGAPNGLDDAHHRQAVRRFQAARGLEDDGIAGPLTREALVRDYMSLDETTLPAEASTQTHGCGETFPVTDTGDNVRSAENRRVEIFFFDGPVRPPPQGETSSSGSQIYLQWLNQVTSTQDFSLADGPIPGSVKLRLLDAGRVPLRKKPYVLEVSGTTFQNITDDRGFLVETLPTGATAGKLSVGEVTMDLVFRGFASCDTPAGAQDRLSNLGFIDIERASGLDDDRLREQLLGFQDSSDLGSTGDLDAPTRSRLETYALV